MVNHVCLSSNICDHGDECEFLCENYKRKLLNKVESSNYQFITSDMTS